MEIVRNTKPDIVAAKALGALLEQYAAEPILLLLSGGSAFSFLDLVSRDNLGALVTIGVLDERIDDRKSVNNFSQLTATKFFGDACSRGCSYIDTSVQGHESLADMAARYDDAITLWLGENGEEGKVIVTLGLGADGHTAGIFPGTVELLETYTSNMVPLEVSKEINEFTKRVTATPHFLRTVVAAGVAYVVGEDKCPVLTDLIANEIETEDFPALIWHQIPNLTVVTSCQE